MESPSNLILIYWTVFLQIVFIFFLKHFGVGISGGLMTSESLMEKWFY